MCADIANEVDDHCTESVLDHVQGPRCAPTLTPCVYGADKSVVNTADGTVKIPTSHSPGLRIGKLNSLIGLRAASDFLDRYRTMLGSYVDLSSESRISCPYCLTQAVRRMKTSRMPSMMEHLRQELCKANSH